MSLVMRDCPVCGHVQYWETPNAPKNCYFCGEPIETSQAGSGVETPAAGGLLPIAILPAT